MIHITQKMFILFILSLPCISFIGEEIDKENVEIAPENIQASQAVTPSSADAETRNNVLKVLGADMENSKFKNITFHPELQNTWSRWMKQGHTALTALGAAVSMILDPPAEGVDEQVLTDFLSHAGQILTGVFYQQSVARKSFITPQLSKEVKLTVEAINSDEWLYGNDLKEKVKDEKAIGKVCANIKEKPQPKILKIASDGKLEIPTCAISTDGLSTETSHSIQTETLPKLLPQNTERDQSDDESVICEEIIQVCQPAGRLRYFIHQWKDITSDSYILSQIKGYKIPFTNTPIQKSIPKKRILSELENKNLQVEIKKLMDKGAIEPCEHCEGEFISQYFLVPKNPTVRIVLFST